MSSNAPPNSTSTTVDRPRGVHGISLRRLFAATERLADRARLGTGDLGIDLRKSQLRRGLRRVDS